MFSNASLLDISLANKSFSAFPMTNLIDCSLGLQELAFWCESKGRILYPLTMSRRAALPLDLPLDVVGKLLSFTLQMLRVKERMRVNRRSHLPLMQLSFQKEGLDLRIVADAPFNRAIVSHQDHPKEGEQVSNLGELFIVYSETRRGSEFEYDGRQIVFSSLQKTVEACLDQKVNQEDREQAIEIVLHSLKHLQRNHHPPNASSWLCLRSY